MAFYSGISIFFFHLFLVFIVGLGAGASQDECTVSKCSKHGPHIKFPFRLKDGLQPDRCGYPGFELSCNERKQTVLELPSAAKVLVKKIDYKSQVIHVSDPDGCLVTQLPRLNLSASPFQFTESYTSDFALYNCSTRRDLWKFVPCLSVHGYHVYAILSDVSIASLPLTSCTKIQNIASSVPPDVLDQKNIRLSWVKPDCSKCEAADKICRWKNNTMEPETDCFYKPKKGAAKKLEVAGAVVGCFMLVLAVIALYYVYSSNKIEKENQAKVEVFLEDYRTLRPTRYSYADIKRITNQFREKLGQGGYGTVYKGMLSHEIFVAVKVLNNTKANGEDFINEVGTIGKIHHVNVVRLVGFCADGFIRALVYEFLPNDSLEKYIFSENPKNQQPLGWERLQDIALGIAKGIEYLHQGCDQRILHFDIKPHNILLDQNFNPKISDFGLAKLCSKEHSAVSMTAARGTMGYIAPEVLSRNFGKVSCKSDVYSYGMLLLEMVGGRKNIDVTVENTCQMYFPEWIYNRLEQGEELQIRVEEDGDAEIAKKLTITGLWCIQWNPVDRPSMKDVIQMLEGDTNNLAMPPNPFATTNATRHGRHIQQDLAVISELQ